MLTLHYVVTGSEKTFPHRGIFRALGMKFDRERKQWYAVDSQRTAERAVEQLGFGYVQERTVEELPPDHCPVGVRSDVALIPAAVASRAQRSRAQPRSPTLLPQPRKLIP